MMNRYPISGDKHIGRIGHDRSTGTVEIQFIDNKPEVLHFWDVPADVFEGLYKASHPFDYYVENIKGKYETRKVEDEEES